MASKLLAPPGCRHGETVAPHICQRYTWDCGLACVEMIIRALIHADEHVHEVLTRVCPTKSVWTIDLAYALNRLGIQFIFYTVQLEADPSYQNQTFYAGLFLVFALHKKMLANNVTLFIFDDGHSLPAFICFVLFCFILFYFGKFMEKNIGKQARPNILCFSITIGSNAHREFWGRFQASEPDDATSTK
jgi:hypothetical protein